MKCDFYRDGNNKIWLYYASDILSRVRILNNVERLEEETLAKQRKMQMEQQREVMRMKTEQKRNERTAKTLIDV